MSEFFHQLDPVGIANRYILLDVDGTIASDRNEQIADEALKVINGLKRKNRVMLLSNNRNRGRIERISLATRLEYLKTKHKKPSKRILADIDPEQRKKILIIGDKLLTDIVFARRIKAPYIKIKRLKSRNDRWFVKISYYFDDLAFLMFKLFFSKNS